MDYIAYINDAEQGPYTFEDLELCEQVGDISDATNIRGADHDIWKPWAKIKQERDEMVARKRAFEASQNPIHSAAVAAHALPTRNLAATTLATPHISTRSRTAYVLLGLFFGCLGVHNFHAGYFGRGLAQAADHDFFWDG